MKRRDEFQRHAVKVIEDIAKRDLGLIESDDDDDLEYSGQWYLGFADTLESWSNLRDFGVLPFAGGWRDQPDEWRLDMRKITRIYNRAFREHKPRKDND